jgi:plastocyanin
VIPLGTGEAIDQGERIDVMPTRLEIDVGDAIEIVNEDERGHNVGLFFVGEGETVSQVFPSVAEFTDVCSVSSSGEFTISVT